MLKINFLLPPTMVAIARVVTANSDAAGLKPMMGDSRDGSDIRNTARTSHQGRFF